MAEKFSTETVRRIFNDEDGVCIEVGPDRDSLDLVEIGIPEGESRKYYGDLRLALHPEQARQLAAALVACAVEMEGKRG